MNFEVMKKEGTLQTPQQEIEVQVGVEPSSFHLHF